MKRLLWLVLFSSGMAYSQGVRYDSVALNPRGAPIPNATITLCTGTATGTPCSPAALGYTDITTGVSCASGFPVVQQIGGGCTSTTDGNGNFGFWLIPGTYKYSISGPSVATPQTYTITVPVGATSAGAASIPTVTTEKPWVNVQFFGADPTGVADSTTAIQNAINFAMASGNCNPLYFPVGTYKVTSAPTYTWTNCNEILVYGDGPQASTISYTAATGNLFTCTGTAAQRKSLGFRNLGLKATAATTAIAISYTACQRLHAQDMQITSFFGGVRITGTGNVGDGTAGNSFDIHIEDSLINNYVSGGYAINVDHSTDLFLHHLELYAIGDSDVTSTGIIFDTGANGNYITGVNAVSGLHSFVFRNTNQGGAFGGVPSGFYVNTMLGDTPAGGDAWLFDSTLSGNNVVMTCTNCWGRRAGITSAAATNNANAIGFNVSGGSDIHFIGGWAIENALNGISVTSTGSNLSFDAMNVQRNNFNNNTANTPGAIVNASPSRVRFNGGTYNNLGGGSQNVGLDWSAVTGTTFEFSALEASNNLSQPIKSPSQFGSVLTNAPAYGGPLGINIMGGVTLTEQGNASTGIPSGVSSSDIIYADVVSHSIPLNYNNGGYTNFIPKTVALTADWTCGTGGTVASCVAATIIGSGGGVPMTFALPGVVNSLTLECHGVVGQATAATLNQWNLLTAGNGATNVTATYDMATAATAAAFGAVTDQASTTTTFQIAPSWTLGGTGTKMPFHIWAKIEGAAALGTTLSLQLVAPTVADLVTIFRGSSCTIY